LKASSFAPPCFVTVSGEASNSGVLSFYTCEEMILEILNLMIFQVREYQSMILIYFLSLIADFLFGTLLKSLI
jgi:hypothetical protein